jgi:hypothetical protein
MRGVSLTHAARWSSITSKLYDEGDITRLTARRVSQATRPPNIGLQPAAGAMMSRRG